jgi:hypothetical protein
MQGGAGNKNLLILAPVTCVGHQRAQHTFSQIVIIIVIGSGKDLGSISQQPVGYKTLIVV